MMGGEFTASYIITEFGPAAAVILYLFLRDRKMERAILKLAEETDGVDRGNVRETLELDLGD